VGLEHIFLGKAKNLAVRTNLQVLLSRPIILIIDETGDKEKEIRQIM